MWGFARNSVGLRCVKKPRFFATGIFRKFQKIFSQISGIFYFSFFVKQGGP